MNRFPAPLNPGDLVGVAAPAGYLEQHERFYQGRSIFEEMGFELYEPEKNWPGYGYLADRDQERAAELHRLWANPEIKAIVALRGGFGSLRLLHLLDIALIKKHPKLFVGFSDITVLHTVFFHETRLICLHGPGLASLFQCDQPSRERLYHCLRGEWHRSLNEDIEVVRGGDPVNGPLLGGNLASLNTLLGTRWFPDLTGAVLLLEDINEPLYRLDRLLTQLWLSGVLNSINGLILGQFSDDQTDPIERQRRHEFVWNRAAELTSGTSIPIWGDFPVGHCRRNLTVPIGADCRMDSRAGRLDFLAE
jgi:muramoyltetrapeptide carboxypeptidase